MEENRPLERLYELGLVVGSTVNLDHETAAFTEWLSRASEVTLAALFITAEDGQALQLVQTIGFPLPAETTLPLGMDPWRWLKERGVRTLQEDNLCRYAVPLVIEQELLGILCVVSCRSGEDLEREQRLVSTAANYLAVVLRNIRRYQALEERMAEVERLNRALSDLLDDLQAANRNLEATAARLRDANEELEAFAYSVSHDLRAPLRAMEGFAQALLEDYAGELDPQGEDYARRIMRAAQRMDRLIQDLLAYSRVSRMEIRRSPVRLRQAIEEALGNLAEEIQARGAQVAIEEPLPTVLAHRSVLVQAVTNLLSNAVKFVAHGVQPRVRIWAEERGERVRLWVEDNGIGIAPEHHERIFRVFERLHGVETYPGTGIGLAIVRKGVERMGGQVGVESEVGQGSRFWVELDRPSRQAWGNQGQT